MAKRTTPTNKSDSGERGGAMLKARREELRATDMKAGGKEEGKGFAVNDLEPDLASILLGAQQGAKRGTKTERKESRDLRYRRTLFPDCENMLFDTKQKGFVPIPIMMRKLLGKLKPAEVRLLLYLHLRASKFRICYPTLDDIVHELGLAGRKNLIPYINSLEEKGLIKTAMRGVKKFFLVLDPRVAIEQMARQKLLTAADLDEINELYEDLGQERVEL